jgi:hypothetical protein
MEYILLLLSHLHVGFTLINDMCGKWYILPRSWNIRHSRIQNLSPNIRHPRSFLSTQSTQLKICQVLYLLTRKFTFNYHWLRVYVTFSHLFNISWKS